jgi:hypothetical protein
VVVGENVVAYFNEGGPPKVTPIQPTIVQVGRKRGYRSQQLSAAST